MKYLIKAEQTLITISLEQHIISRVNSTKTLHCQGNFKECLEFKQSYNYRYSLKKKKKFYCVVKSLKSFKTSDTFIVKILFFKFINFCYLLSILLYVGCPINKVKKMIKD